MLTLFLLILPPLLIAIIVKVTFNATITWVEWGIQSVGVMLIISIVYLISMKGQITDTEIWAGTVTKKSQVEVDCYHPYECNCREECSGSGDSESCHTECDTCYEHNEDWYWRVYSSLGSYSQIANIDRRGKKEPPRFASVQIHEPYNEERRFDNYIQAVPESLFNLDEKAFENYIGKIPSYPRVHDYYKVRRAINVDANIPDIKEWNYNISEKNKILGSLKEVNMLVIFTRAQTSEYRYALEANWKGGKKNDVIVILGVPQYPNIAWADTITYGKNKGNSLMTVEMRSALMELDGHINAENGADAIATVIRTKFDRVDPKEFEHLESAVEPPVWLIVLSLVLGVVLSSCLTWYFHMNDISSSRGHSYNRYRRFR